LLGDDAIRATSRIPQPGRRGGEILGRGREHQPFWNCRVGHEPFELAPPVLQGPIDDDRLWRREHIEQNKARRRLLREFANADFSRMQPHLQDVEGQPPLDLDDEFPIDNEMVGGNGLLR
jgi:hypothetical protein